MEQLASWDILQRSINKKLESLNMPKIDRIICLQCEEEEMAILNLDTDLLIRAMKIDLNHFKALKESFLTRYQFILQDNF